MTTPYNHFAPWFQRQSLLAYNAGSEELQPFSVVEVLGADRPESGMALTFGGGITRVRVGTPTQSNPDMTVTLGPIKIRPGDEGPALACVESYARFTGTVQVGDEVGVENGSTQLSTDFTGYFVMGDIDTTTGICRVMRSGGGGGTSLRIGVLQADVDHLEVETARIVAQDGILTSASPTETLEWAYASASDARGLVDCLNISKITLRGGSINAGTPTSEVLVYVEEIKHFDMHICFPAQIEECLNPAEAIDTSGQ